MKSNIATYGMLMAVGATALGLGTALAGPPPGADPDLNRVPVDRGALIPAPGWDNPLRDWLVQQYKS